MARYGYRASYVESGKIIVGLYKRADETEKWKIVDSWSYPASLLGSIAEDMAALKVVRLEKRYGARDIDDKNIQQQSKLLDGVSDKTDNI